MSFKGAIDFQQTASFDDEEVRIYNAFESSDKYVLPDGIGLSLTNAGKPDLTITLVQSKDGPSDIALYGTLDLRLSLLHPVENAVKALRKSGDQANVVTASCTGGYLQLQPVDGNAALPAVLWQPVNADWKTVGPTPFLFRLDTSSVSLIRKALQAGTLLITARAVLEYKGIAARLPLKIHFNSKDLFASIQKSPGWAKDRIQADDLQRYFSNDPDVLPITIAGSRDKEQPGLFAAAMTDRLLERFGKLAIPDFGEDKIFYSLTVLQEAGSGQFDWDLSEVTEISRAIDLRLNPLTAARQLTDQEGGVENSFREVHVPALQTGFRPLHVSANIPSYRPNVLKAGVQITAAPHVPERMQAISESIEFNYPEDSSDIVLRFSPAEAGNYNFRPFMLINGSSGVRNISGKETTAVSDMLLLNTDDFSVKFLMVEAAPQVLEIATLTVSFNDAGTTGNKTFEINKARPLLSFGFATSDPWPDIMQVNAKSLATGENISVTVTSPVSMSIGLHHLPGYGYHNISICCHFNGKKPAVTIELQPESPGENVQPSLCFFTPENNCRDWGYFADSPFSCGFRYRLKENDSVGEWSAIQSPFSPLSVDDSKITL